MINAEYKQNLNRLVAGLAASLIIGSISATSSVSLAVPTAVPAAKVRTYEASETVSHFIRDNAPDYWRWSKTNAKKYFGNLMAHEGIVLGDAHPGNFIYAPLAGKMRLFMMDMKDAGKGAFISDIARQIMATNVIFKEGEEDLYRSTERQLEAYHAGLSGTKFEAHEKIEWIFDTTKSDYSAELAEYVEDKTVGSTFKFKNGMIERLKDHVTLKHEKEIQSSIRAMVEKQMKGAKVLDFAFRPRERGGSKNLKRYWALVETKGKRIIFEFKEVEAPAVAQYTEQLPAAKRFDLVMKTLWGVIDPLYYVGEISGQPFWMRPKKIDVFDVPYKQKDKEARKFLRHLANYEAYLMGQYHGKQTGNKKYANEIEKKFDDLVEDINTMSDDYVERLTEKVETLQENEDYD